MYTRRLGRQALLLLCVLTNVCGTCPAQMDATIPAGLAVTALAQVGPQGPQGLQGPPGPAGSNATVTAGDGINVNAGQVSLNTGFTDGLYWKQGGNANTDPMTNFLGTTDAQPMELRANNRRGLRIEYTAHDIVGQPGQSFAGVNTISGYDGNSVAAGVVGATVGGGMEFVNNGMVTPIGNSVMADFGTIGGGSGNQILSRMLNNQTVGQHSAIVGGSSNQTNENFAFIGGGIGNHADGGVSVIGGGQSNAVTGNYGTIGGGAGNEATTLATIGGGQSHDALGQFSFVGGGSNNDTAGSGATIGGGFDNVANGEAATVPGGRDNWANGAHSFAAGYKARANHSGSFVWGDPGMNSTASFANNQFFVGTTGGICLARSDPLNGFNTTTSNAAVMIEKLNDFGEALWIWQRKEQPDSIPVIKIHRNSNATNNNNYVEGWDWSGPGSTPTLIARFHINKNGSFVAGSDFAEALPVVGDPKSYEPGDVVVFSDSESGRVEKCERPADTRVAGVYSTRPGLLGAEKEGGATRIDANDIPVAIVGLVPTKVSCENGPIRPGDLLTTSTSRGHAMRATGVKVGEIEVYPTGTIIGKAIEELSQGTGKIRVLITLK